MRTVIRLLHEGAEKFGDAAYLGEKTSNVYKTTSFKEADKITKEFAAGLLLKGLQKGDQFLFCQKEEQTGF